VTGFSLGVISYEELVREERNRQIVSAVLVGAAAVGNAYSASQAGYYNANSTVTTPRGGTYRVNTTGYSPTAAAIARSNAAVQNEAMISSTIESGQQNLANLERGVIKDNTQPPASASSGAAKSYSIAFNVGSDRHQIEIVQEGSR
jgi:Tfp pilus assembly protein PilE